MDRQILEARLKLHKAKRTRLLKEKNNPIVIEALVDVQNAINTIKRWLKNL